MPAKMPAFAKEADSVQQDAAKTGICESIHDQFLSSICSYLSTLIHSFEMGLIFHVSGAVR